MALDESQVTGPEFAVCGRAAAAPHATPSPSCSSGGGAIAQHAGMDALVTKTPRPSRVAEDSLGSVVLTSAVPGGSAASPPEHAQRVGHQVLIAEDNPINQLFATRLLEKRGCSVDVAVNGQEAVEMHSRGNYAAIFMDCQMPELDGYQATAEIRRRENTDRHTPIIAITASTMPGDRDRCLNAGMDDYLGKPVEPLLLDEILARIFRNVPDTPPTPRKSEPNLEGR
jgi:two-component system sensor histidine kinase/response regulator